MNRGQGFFIGSQFYTESSFSEGLGCCMVFMYITRAEIVGLCTNLENRINMGCNQKSQTTRWKRKNLL